jgi:hypothetical protein
MPTHSSAEVHHKSGEEIHHIANEEISKVVSKGPASEWLCPVSKVHLWLPNHHGSQKSHLSSFISDTLAILDSSNDRCDGSSPTEMKMQALGEMLLFMNRDGHVQFPTASALTLTLGGPAPLLWAPRSFLSSSEAETKVSYWTQM